MAGIGRTAGLELEAQHLRPLLSERIPAEVWLQVIEVSNFNREDITNLILVSKFVRWISQPLLFQTITLSIHKRITGSPGTTTPYLDRAQERLAFCTQHRIAHGVKSVVIRAEISGTLRPVEEYLIDASPLIEAVFTSLPFFPNIYSFSISNSNLSGRHFDVLAQLPRLSGLHFNECSGTGDLRLSRFNLTELSLHGTIGGTFGWWISLIKPSSLRRLSYSAPSEATVTNAADSLNLFFPAVSIGPRLSNLTILHLPCRAPKFQCYASALQRCPNIEVLIIEPELVSVTAFNPIQLPTTFPFLPLSILPKLRAVDAPYAFVMESLSGRQLKHIRIEDTMGSTGTVLNLARGFSSIQELVISVDIRRWERYADLLRGVFGCLTGLHSLHIRIEGAFLAADINQVWDLLREAQSLPGCMRSLRIISTHNARPILGAQSDSIDVTSAESTKVDEALEAHTSVVSELHKYLPDLVDVCVETPGRKGISWQKPYTKLQRWWDWEERFAVGPPLGLR